MLIHLNQNKKAMDIILNENQSKIFKSIFDSNVYQRHDCPSEIAFWGGYGSGKSYISIVLAFLLCRQHANAQILMTRFSYRQLKDTCIVQFKEVFPPNTNNYIHQKADHEFHFTNGSKIIFRSFDDPRKILSSSYDAVIMCQAEELKEEHFLGALGRLRGTALPKKFIFTEGNPRFGWCKKRYHDQELPKNCMYIRASTYSNKKNLTEDYIKNMEENYPPSYIKQFLEGNWDSVQNAVYDCLMDHHVIPKQRIQKHWYKCIGLDHGTRVDTSIVFLAKDELGNIYIYDEWHKSKPLVSDIVNACNKYGPLPIIADYSMKVADRDYGSWWKDLQAEGLRLIEAKKEKSGNILLINQLLWQNKLMFFNHLKYVIDQHKNYRYVDTLHSNTDEFKVVKKDDHSVDAVQYAIRHIKDIKVKSPANAFKPDINQKTLRDYVEGRV